MKPVKGSTVRHLATNETGTVIGCWLNPWSEQYVLTVRLNSSHRVLWSLSQAVQS